MLSSTVFYNALCVPINLHFACRAIEDGVRMHCEVFDESTVVYIQWCIQTTFGNIQKTVG